MWYQTDGTIVVYTAFFLCAGRGHFHATSDCTLKIKGLPAKKFVKFNPKFAYG